MTDVIARIWSRILLLALAIAIAWVEPDASLSLGLADGSLGSRIGEVVVQSLVLIAGAMLLIRLIHVVVWDGVVARRAPNPPPRLLTDLVDGFVVTVTVTLIIAFVLDQPVNGLIATSGVAVAVIGFAMKSMISDLFSGIAITIERPFQIGDWIEIPGWPVGRVCNMSWRATDLELESGVHLVVPNGHLSEMVLKIYDRPSRPWRDDIDINLGYEVSPSRAERILLAAACDVPEVAAMPIRPDTRIVAFAETGVTWRLRYWVPDYFNRGVLRDAVQRNVLRNLHFSGVTVPVPKVYAHAQPPEDPGLGKGTKDFLRRVALFAMLTDDEMATLAGAAEFRLIRAGTDVVRAGDGGDSLFLVKEGLMDVLIATPAAGDTMVAHLKSGHFFGEMSLLTGAPRGATVRAVVDSTVIEITKAALEPILSERDALMEVMSAALAERQLQNRLAETVAPTPVDIREEQKTLARQLLARMRAFFRIGVPVN